MRIHNTFTGFHIRWNNKYHCHEKDSTIPNKHLIKYLIRIETGTSTWNISMQIKRKRKKRKFFNFRIKLKSIKIQENHRNLITNKKCWIRDLRIQVFDLQKKVRYYKQFDRSQLQLWTLQIKTNVCQSFSLIYPLFYSLIQRIFHHFTSAHAAYHVFIMNMLFLFFQMPICPRELLRCSYAICLIFKCSFDSEIHEVSKCISTWRRKYLLNKYRKKKFLFHLLLIANICVCCFNDFVTCYFVCIP